MKKIVVTCDTKDHLNYKVLQPFQGNLKDLTEENFEKLKKSIIEEGFSAPIFVWREADQYYILDGHQRKRVIEHLVEKEKYECPDLPVVFIYAETWEKARRKLLSYVSQYGTINEQGLYEYLFDSKIELKELATDFHIPALDVEQFISNYDNETEKINVEFEASAQAEDRKQYIVALMLKNESEMQSVYREMMDRGFICKLIT